MNENIKWFAAAAAVVGLFVGAVIYRDKWWSDAPPAETPATPVKVQPVAPEEPAIQHPLPEPEAQEALPALNDSDASMNGVIEGLVGKQFAQQFIISKDLVRHVVVSIDNLSAEKVPERIRPVKSPPDAFVAGGTEDAPVLDPANYPRYQPMVQRFVSLDTPSLVATYTRYYPLFQEAYESLGHPPEYFNDRLIEVIDHLLATPDIQGPIALARPSVHYEFADPQIESRSAGQKLLIRMGSDNAKRVKDKLRELRGALSAKQPDPSNAGP